MALFSRLRATLFPRHHDESIDQELAFHIERRAAEYEAAGLTPDEARRKAQLHFGNRMLQRERMRDVDRVPWVEHLFQDVRFSLRTMRKTPLVTAVALLSLTLGIGANTAIFTVLDALLLKTLPIQDAGRVVFLSWSAKNFPDEVISLHGRAKATDGGLTTSTALSYPFFEDLGRRAKTISGLAGFVSLNQIPVTANGAIRMSNGQAVSGSYHATLGISPAIGRTLGASDDVAGAPAVAMISYRFWTSRLGSDPEIVGKRITIQNVPFVIVGVEPSSFLGLIAGTPPDVIIPLHRLLDLGKQWNDPSDPIFSASDYWWVRIAARLAPGVTESQAAVELGALFRQSLPKAEHLPSLGLHHSAEGADDIREQFQGPLMILMCMVGVVLLIACANVGNLLLSRAQARQKETAMRMALGASRGRLIRQHLTESVLLAGLGGALGLGLAYRASSALVAALPTFAEALVFDLRPDLRILAFTIAVSLLTGLLYGLAPAFQAVRADLQPSLQSRAQLGGVGLAHILVVAQLAASVVVLAGAGLYVRTLRNLRMIDTGMTTSNLLAFRVETDPSAGYTPRRTAEFFRRVRERLQTIPEIRGVTMASLIPLSGNFHSVPVEVPGGVAPRSFEDRIAALNIVGPNFLETMGISLRLGRGIEERDQDGAPRAAVINEAMARTFFPDQSPIGRRFRASFFRQEHEYEVVGVAANTKFATLRRSFRPGFFASSAQHMSELEGMTFELRLRGDAVQIAAAVRQAVAEVDPSVPVTSLMTLDEQIDNTLKQERLFAHLSSAFGGLALLLASIGLYGVRSYSVSRRTAEVGVRMALGATPREIIAMVMRETAGLTGVGIAIGLLAGLALSGLIRSMLFGLAPQDPATFAGAALLLAAVAALAGFLPALRAARVDPMAALRRDD